MYNGVDKKVVFLIMILIGSNLLWGVKYFGINSRFEVANVELSQINQNKKVLIFQKMFVEKVLKADGVVDFDTRVELQNAVKDISDDSITEAWNTFLSSKTESEGQLHVKNLLSLLADSLYQN